MKTKIGNYYDFIVICICLFLSTYILIPSYLSISIGVFYISIDRIVFLLLFIIWLIGIFFLNNSLFFLKRRVRENKFIVYSMVLFFLSLWISLPFSFDISYSLKILSNYTLFGFLFFIIILTIPNNRKYYSYFGKTILYSSILLFIICLYEIFLGKVVFEEFVRTNLNLSSFQETILLSNYRGGQKRIQGTFNNPLVLGQYIMMAIPALWYFRIFLKNKWLISITIIALISLSYFVRSRTVLILSIIFIIYSTHYLIIYTRNRSNKYIVYVNLFLWMIGSIIIIALLWYLFDFKNYFGGQNLISDTSRLTQLRMAYDLLSEWPLFGFGVGMGAQILGFGAFLNSPTVDNFFLSISLDSGFIALFVFLIFLASILLKYFDLYKRDKILFLSLFLFMVYLFTLSVKQGHTIFYFLLGILLNIYTDNKIVCRIVKK